MAGNAHRLGPDRVPGEPLLLRLVSRPGQVPDPSPARKPGLHLVDAVERAPLLDPGQLAVRSDARGITDVSPWQLRVVVHGLAARPRTLLRGAPHRGFDLGGGRAPGHQVA